MILFIDFDGVMHRACIGKDVDMYFQHADLLAAWIREHEDVHIVVSSSWREQFTLEELKDLLFYSHADLQARVVGMTRDLSSLYSGQERSAECQLWMVENGYHFAAWAAIDDQAERFSRLLLNSHVVACDPAFGLTQSELDLAWALLERQRFDEPRRRAYGERNGAPLRQSQQNFLHALKTFKAPEIKTLTDEREAGIVEASRRLA